MAASPAAVEERSVSTVSTMTGQRPELSGSDAYVRTVLGAGAAKNLLDVVRSAVKLPEAARAGRLASGLAQTLTASPTTHLIDPRAPRVATAASGWRSFTVLDESLYRSASFIGVGLGAFQLGMSIPNIVNAVKAGGPRALYDSRAGREGVLQATAGVVTLGAFARGGVAARMAGVTGPGRILLAAATSPQMASPIVLGASLAASGLVLANSRGFLDFMNRGEQRSLAQVERDAWSGLDVPGKLRQLRAQLS